MYHGLLFVLLYYMTAHSVSLEIGGSDAHFIRALDAQKASGKGLFGSGFLRSEKAAAEKVNTDILELSEREWKIVRGLGNDN